MDAVPHKTDAVCFDGGCCATSARCSVAAVVAEPSAVSLNVDAVPTPWMQCNRRGMECVVTEDAVFTKRDAVSLQ